MSVLLIAQPLREVVGLGAFRDLDTIGLNIDVCLQNLFDIKFS